MLQHLIKQARKDGNWSSGQETAEKRPRTDSSRGKKVPARRIFKICTILAAHSTEVSQAVAAPGTWHLSLHLLHEQPLWLCGCQWLRPHVGPSHPRCEVVASTEGRQGRPCPYLGRTQASGAVAMVTSVTRGAKPTGRNAGHSRASASCG